MSDSGNGSGGPMSEYLDLSARVSLLEQARRGHLGVEAELLAGIRELQEDRRSDRDLLAEVNVKIDVLLARGKRKRRK